MPKVILPTVFQGPTRGVSEIQVEGASIVECVDAVEALYPGVRAFVLDGDSGGIHKFVKVTLDGELLARDRATLEQPISAEAEIEVIAAIAGG